MPAAIEYILDASSREAESLDTAHRSELRKRIAMAQRNWKYYDGEMPNPLAVEKDGVDDNILLPKIGQIAEKIVSFLLGDKLEFTTGENEGEDSEGQESDIDLLWDANRKEQILHSLALTGTLTGHCWMRVEPRLTLPPKIVPLNPEHCSVFWQVDDIDNVLWYRLQYRTSTGGPGKRIDYVKGRPDFGTKRMDHTVEDEWWEFTYVTDDEKWSRWVLKDTPVKLQWPVCPVVDWQNMIRPHNYYGANDVSLAIGLNDSLNKIASQFARILKHHASPRTVAIGMKADEIIPSKIGGIWAVDRPTSEASINNLEMTSDLASSRAFMEMLQDEIWAVSRMTDPRSMKDRLGALTNFGLRVLFTDAIKRTATKRAMYGGGLEQVNKTALIIWGRPVPQSIGVEWDDVLPEDTVETADIGMKEVDAKLIDKQTYREQRGYNHLQIEERLKAQAEEEQAAAEVAGEQFARMMNMGEVPGEVGAGSRPRGTGSGNPPIEANGAGRNAPANPPPAGEGG
jgi:hypothetical protein